MTAVPDDWPYADEATDCAACGSDDHRFVAVDTLGLVWGAAMQGGLAPTEVGDYGGTLRFRCCRDCWTDAGVEALDDARTLLADDATRRADSFELDDEKVAAAAELRAERVEVETLRELDFRSDPEREHVRAQDRAVETVLESWFGE